MSDSKGVEKGSQAGGVVVDKGGSTAPAEPKIVSESPLKDVIEPLREHRTCSTCFHWDQEKRNVKFGLCRADLPKILTRPNNRAESPDGLWPKVRDDEWCGCWKAK